MRFRAEPVVCHVFVQDAKARSRSRARSNCSTAATKWPDFSYHMPARECSTRVKVGSFGQQGLQEQRVVRPSTHEESSTVLPASALLAIRVQGSCSAASTLPTRSGRRTRVAGRGGHANFVTAGLERTDDGVTNRSDNHPPQGEDRLPAIRHTSWDDRTHRVRNHLSGWSRQGHAGGFRRP